MPTSRLSSCPSGTRSCARTPAPSLVAGVFNSRAIGPWLQQEGFTWVTRALPGTARRFGRGFSLDHVFARGLRLDGEAPSAGCVEARGISDHCAVWVRLAPAASR